MDEDTTAPSPLISPAPALVDVYAATDVYMESVEEDAQTPKAADVSNANTQDAMPAAKTSTATQEVPGCTDASNVAAEQPPQPMEVTAEGNSGKDVPAPEAPASATTSVVEAEQPKTVVKADLSKSDAIASNSSVAEPVSSNNAEASEVRVGPTTAVNAGAAALSKESQPSNKDASSTKTVVKVPVPETAPTPITVSDGNDMVDDIVPVVSYSEPGDEKMLFSKDARWITPKREQFPSVFAR